MTTGTATRPRISAEFIAAHRRARIAHALAECIVAKGYEQTSVAHIVSTAGIARNTFYDTFAGKDAGAEWLLSEASPDLAADLPWPDGPSSLAVFALEMAAPLHLGHLNAAGENLRHARWVLRELADHDWPEGPASPLDPLQSALPPGRHGLPRDFVLENQRQRLFSGLVTAIVDLGYPATTISDITRHAAVSRRTFYEHFDSKHQAAEALLVSMEVDELVTKVDLESGLGSLVMEIAASTLAGDGGALFKTAAANGVLDMLNPANFAEASDA